MFDIIFNRVQINRRHDNKFKNKAQVRDRVRDKVNPSVWASPLRLQTFCYKNRNDARENYQKWLGSIFLLHFMKNWPLGKKIFKKNLMSSYRLFLSFWNFLSKNFSILLKSNIKKSYHIISNQASSNKWKIKSDQFILRWMIPLSSYYSTVARQKKKISADILTHRLPQTFYIFNFSINILIFSFWFTFLIF